jgi:hypothetical protein
MTQKKKKSSKKKPFSRGTPSRSIQILLSEGLKTPIREDAQIEIGNEAEHAFFLRCFELYRVLELISRRMESMIDTYSKYRTREVFAETLAYRYFDDASGKIAESNPQLNLQLVAMYNQLHELRVSLLYEDALPHTLRTRIEGHMALLRKEWQEFTQLLETHLGWKLRIL